MGHAHKIVEIIVKYYVKMPEIEEKNDTEEEDMEQYGSENEKSEDEEYPCLYMSSGSDEDESSELDEEECEQRRSDCMNDMADLEKQFNEIKEFLYRERSKQVETKLQEVQVEEAKEYLTPLAELEQLRKIRIEVAGILKDLELKNITNKFEAEEQACEQHFYSEKILLSDVIKEEIEEKIRRLEEDRHNIDISSDIWNESQARKNKLKKKDGKSYSGNGERKKKTITVTGPFIIYMLKDIEIMDDWTIIKKHSAMKSAQKKEKVFPKQEKNPYRAHYEDGKLYYEGSCYSKGHHIIIDNNEDSPVHATITAINDVDVCVKRSDGNKSKLYIAKLQKG